MKVLGLDSKEYSWNITKYNTQSGNCSSYHERARQILTELFPYDKIYEEVVLPGVVSDFSKRPLIADFYIHFYRLMIEVQGEQHYSYNTFFHKNKLEFFRAQRLDNLKQKWCNINAIKLITLPYNKNDDEWRYIICSR